MSDRFLKLNEVVERTGLCRSLVYERPHDFPGPVKLADNAVGWSEREIAEWIERRKQEPRAPKRPKRVKKAKKEARA